MSDLNAAIESISEKTDRLIGALQAARESQSKAQQALGTLTTQVQELKAENSRLTHELKVLKMSAALRGDAETAAETKRKLGQMVKEIDRCLAALND